MPIYLFQCFLSHILYHYFYITLHYFTLFYNFKINFLLFLLPHGLYFVCFYFFFFQMKYNYKASSPRRLRWTLKAQFRIPFVIFFFLFMDYHLFSVSWNIGCRKKSFLYLLKTLSSSFISSWIYSCQVLWNMFLIIHHIINYRQCKLK